MVLIVIDWLTKKKYYILYTINENVITIATITYLLLYKV